MEPQLGIFLHGVLYRFQRGRTRNFKLGLLVSIIADDIGNSDRRHIVIVLKKQKISYQFEFGWAMKTSHRTPFLFLIFTLAVQLSACGVAIPSPTPTAAAAPSLTPSAIPTSTEPPPPSPTSTLIASLPISPAPDGLRMAYIIDKNLYFQDGSKTAVQLTYSGDDL